MKGDMNTIPNLTSCNVLLNSTTNLCNFFYVPQRMIDDFKLCPDADTCLAQIKSNDYMAVAVAKAYVMNNPRWPNGDFFCFPDADRIQGYPISFFVSAHTHATHHSVLSRMNGVIQMAVEGGLLAKWSSDTEQTLMDDQPYTFGPQQLSFNRLFMPLCFYVSLTFIATIIFIVELIVHSKITRPNASRFWVIVNMAIDGKRHFLLRN